ncbi:MAG: hypothetical protein MHM6MM_000981 [Cercozoa sp. M6MM]
MYRESKQEEEEKIRRKREIEKARELRKQGKTQQRSPNAIEPHVHKCAEWEIDATQVTEAHGRRMSLQEYKETST